MNVEKHFAEIEKEAEKKLSPKEEQEFATEVMEELNRERSQKYREKSEFV